MAIIMGDRPPECRAHASRSSRGSWRCIGAKKFRLTAGIEVTHVPYRGGAGVIADITGDASVFISAH
jgi:tripartite-type tricarboxylate transporter receptor subunit TctC